VRGNAAEQDSGNPQFSSVGEPDLVVGLACRTHGAGVLGLPGTLVAALPNEVTRFVDGLEDNLAMQTGKSGARVLRAGRPARGRDDHRPDPGRRVDGGPDGAPAPGQ
jgi:hypothetical protein